MFAIPALDRGGPDRVFFELMKYFSDQQYQVSLAVSETTGFYMEQLPQDVRVLPLGAKKYPWLALLKQIRTRKPDVVLSTLSMTLTCYTSSLFFSRNTKHVPRVANQLSEASKELKRSSFVKHRLAFRVLRRALRRADHVICQSSDMANDVAQITGSSVPISAIGNPINPEDIILKALPPLKLPGSPPLLAVGKLAKQKGFDVLLRAMPMILKKHPDAVLTILGEGAERAPLDTLLDELNLRQNVVLAGISNNPYRAMKGAEILISSSRYEGFPNAVLEAMACETLVVATDCPGATKELITNGETGYLCRAKILLHLETLSFLRSSPKAAQLDGAR